MPEEEISQVLPPLTPTGRTKTKGKRITAKQKRFAKAFVKNKGNATQAVIETYDTDNRGTAQSIGSENLSKPIVRQEIVRLLKQEGIEMTEILSTHRRNMLQNKHYPTSQKAVSDFYDILGMRNAEKPSSEVKIAFIVHKG